MMAAGMQDEVTPDATPPEPTTEEEQQDVSPTDIDREGHLK